jgi:hypothetical protein
MAGERRRMDWVRWIWQSIVFAIIFTAVSCPTSILATVDLFHVHVTRTVGRRQRLVCDRQCKATSSSAVQNCVIA